MLLSAAIGIVIALATVGLAWAVVATDIISSDQWKIAALLLLGAELVFLLFIPANKGGQQFGPHGGGGISPVVSAGAEFQDRDPSRRLGDWRWLFIGIPVLLVLVGVLISL